MRVALYTRSIESARGAERAAVNLLMGLSARGHDIALLLEDQRGWLIDELRSSCPEATIVNLRASDVSWLSQRLYQARAFVSMMIDNAITASRDWCIRPLFDLIFSDNAPIAALCQYIKAQQPDVIISFLNSPNAILLVTSRVDRRRTRKVVSVHNTISVVANKNASKRNQVMPRLMRRLFPFADAIVAPSSGVAEDLAKVSGLNSEKISMIYNPIVGNSLLKQAEADVETDIFAANMPIIVASGKLKPQKGFETLLTAFREIRDQLPSRLVVLGEGPDREKLLEMTEKLGLTDDVSFIGQVRNPFAYYRRASIFVLSSEWEGLPTVLIEAMACGCPVVSTDCPSGPKEILEDGRFGPLVPVGDPRALAHAVLQALVNPVSKELLVERARCFSIEESVRHFERVLTGRKTDALSSGAE